MSKVYLWLEGVDFAEFIDDTNQIAVIRGASLALLAAGEEAEGWLKRNQPALAPEKIFSGASLSLFRLACDESGGEAVAAALRRHLADSGLNVLDVKQPVTPFAYLRFVTGVATDDGTPAAIRRAHARARHAQAHGVYHPPARLETHETNRFMCAMSRSRQADCYMRLTEDQVATYGANVGRRIERDADAFRLPVSRSVAARRYYGRKAREEFFARRKGTIGFDAARFGFVNDLHEMVDLAPLADDLSSDREEMTFALREAGQTAEQAWREAPRETVRNKLAVFHVDGNDFTAIRDAMGGSAAALREFDEQVTALLERKVLAGFMRRLQAHADAPDVWTPIPRLRALHGSVYRRPDTEPDDPDPQNNRLRFELLLYGGDEMAFILPAWLGLEFAGLFFDAVADAHILWNGKRYDLRFKMGLAFVNYKMPIREARNLAYGLCDIAKTKDRNTIAIQAFESIEPPANGLGDVRSGLFGDEPVSPKQTVAHAVMDADRLAETVAGLMAFKRAGAARSQLYGMLRAAQWTPVRGRAGTRHVSGKLGAPGVNAKAAGYFEDYARRMLAQARPEPALAALFARLQVKETAAMEAWLATHLYDYVDPLGYLEFDAASGASA